MIGFKNQMNCNVSKNKVETVILVIILYVVVYMNSFNKTEVAVFSCRLCFLMAFPFISLIIIKVNISKKSVHKNLPA